VVIRVRRRGLARVEEPAKFCKRIMLDGRRRRLGLPALLASIVGRAARRLDEVGKAAEPIEHRLSLRGSRGPAQ
jgi:hypothetical protein